MQTSSLLSFEWIRQFSSFPHYWAIINAHILYEYITETENTHNWMKPAESRASRWLGRLWRASNCNTLCLQIWPWNVVV